GGRQPDALHPRGDPAGRGQLLGARDGPPGSTGRGGAHRAAAPLVLPIGEAHVSMPTVSVVVPTRNRPELMREAVRAALAQDYNGAIEVVVVYDQSEPEPGLSDELADALDGSRRSIRVETNTTRAPGLAGARNHGIGAATGELVAFCDDD